MCGSIGIEWKCNIFGVVNCEWCDRCSVICENVRCIRREKINIVLCRSRWKNTHSMFVVGILS